MRCQALSEIFSGQSGVNMSETNWSRRVRSPRRKARMLLFVLAAAATLTVASGLMSEKTCSALEKEWKRIGWSEFPKLYTDIYGVAFPNKTHGWVCGSGGMIYHTKDRGITWERQDSNSNKSLVALSFVDVNNGWAVGERGTCLSTVDGGRTWEEKSPPTEELLLSVAFADTRLGLVAGDWGKVFRTNDGGRTWQDVSLEEDILLYGLEFVNESEVWMAAETGVLFHSRDGGMTWEKLDSGEGHSFFEISFDENRNGVAVGMLGAIYTTSDGGSTWHFKKASNKSLYNIQMQGGEGVAIGDACTILRTLDGGISWYQVQVPSNLKQNWLQGLGLVKPGKYIIGGQRGTFLFLEPDGVKVAGEEKHGRKER